ncbi:MULTISPECIES: MFS transporter [Bacillus]|uniref:MFS transporter n=1 Tax=Bacillus glycinifermentans TaxID=1664069 RepID=A0AAJ3YZV9_9BACI|nr:MFS transporter [Bacillus sp. TH008]MBU8786957.1 MFS transporter [Bacillus glycinifermentans]NUJ15983.1 MFS transporter [Bacillus glycinifermentans]QAT66216.1 MFS transporter [Bacillus glycinifermentans]SCA86957.1 putative symporter YnaJ [Bacillus glycinifermentans]
MASETLEKISMFEKSGYASGDLACNLIYTTVSTYLLFFYTDVYGLSAAAAGTMFLVVRIIDALADPFIGTIVDRTNSKFGRFRPYLLFGAFPLSVLAILCFTTPDFSDTGKLIYAYITYVGLSLTYTTINVPYGALTSAMTRNNQEVVSITSVRMVFANLGGLIVSFFVPLLSAYLGDTTGNKALGWQLTMSMLGIIGACLLIFCFKSTKERVTLQKPEEKIEFSDIFEQFGVNRPLVVLSIFFIIIFGVNSISNSVGIYYMTYNAGREDLVKWYGLLGSLPALAILPFIPRINKWLGKRKLLNTALLLNIVPPSNVFLVLFFRVIAAVGSVTAGGYMWALIPETIEYGEYKTGKRLSGLIYAIIGFFFKFGMALGGVVPGLILDKFGYVAGQAQTPEALTGILITTTVVPVIFLILAMIDINFYNLSEEKYAKVVRELENKDKVTWTI